MSDDGGLAAVVAHVLLNSVSALHGSLTLARRPDVSEGDRQQLLDVAHRHSTAITTLLRDLIAGDHTALTMTPRDLGAIVETRRDHC